jgi:hypothetical protein
LQARWVHSAGTPESSHTLRAGGRSANLRIMSMKPRWRRETPAQAANDNKPNAKPVAWFAWNIYRAAARHGGSARSLRPMLTGR